VRVTLPANVVYAYWLLFITSVSEAVMGGSVVPETAAAHDADCCMCTRLPTCTADLYCRLVLLTCTAGGDDVNSRILVLGVGWASVIMVHLFTGMSQAG
jgi:hypothetical protein